MDARSNDPTDLAPGRRPRAPGATLSARILAHPEHGLMAFNARWENPEEEITHDRADDGAEGER
ncbi:hypothetical protein ACFWC9_38000 [Streptomyces goshikiensis]|uniref:hypothetical protein n=1 Tax=Streptomyces goshikiensis TaxID=1942 RepID=UPI003692DD32